MKKLLTIIFAVAIANISFAQQTKKKSAKQKAVASKPVPAPVPAVVKDKNACDTLVVNLDSGMVNKLKMTDPIDTLKKYLPCFSEVFAEGSEEHCGGGVIYEKFGFFANTARDYFEILPNFTGKIPVNVFNKSEEELTIAIGDPVQISDYRPYENMNWSVYLYRKSWGTLAVWFNNTEKKFFKLQMYPGPFEKLDFCLD